VTNNNSDAVSVLLGNGDGTFQAPVSYPAGSNPQSVAVGDFNGDGLPDLAVVNVNDNTVSVLLNAADWGGGAPGGLPRPRIHALPTIASSQLALGPRAAQLATSQPQTIGQCIPDQTTAPVRPAPQGMSMDQPARSQATLLPTVVTPRHPRDAVFEELGHHLGYLPAVSWVQ
jgi:hypothetical protein